MKEDNKKSYYAIIPANVRYDKSLTPNAKLLYGEITALCNEKGYCWARNNYFAELYKVSKVSISKWINQLKRNGYINIEMEYRENSKEILNRYLRIVNYPSKENFNTPSKEKLKDNNTTINNTMNNTIEKIYKLYPAKCSIRGTSTGKSQKCKDKIKLLLKKDNDNLIEIINRYIKECMESKTWVMNFKTFLNNLPDYSEQEDPEEDNNDSGMCEAEKEYFRNLEKEKLNV